MATIFPPRTASAAARRASSFFESDAARRIPQFKLRAAGGTGIRLGMKSPVVRIFVFGAAIRAHCEGLHGCVRAVVGERFDDRETGTAVGAVGKRITIAPVLGIEYLRAGIPGRWRCRGGSGRFWPRPVHSLRISKSVEKDRVQEGKLQALNK